MRPKPPLLCAIGSVLLAALGGCEGDDIRTYTAPAPVAEARPTPTPAPAAATPAARPVPDAPPGEVTLTWTVPEGWRPAKDPPGFVLAAYDAGAESDGVQATVSRLAGAGGGAVANINRWRGQVGLPAIAELPEQPMTRIDVGDGAAGMVDLVGEAGPGGEPTRVLGAILPRATPPPGETWFVKMTGPRDKVEPHVGAFIALVASLRPVETGAASGAEPNNQAQ